MLRCLKDLEGYTVSATDGDMGTVVNFLLDDERWVVRYLVVETGVFLNGQRVLISPISFGSVEWQTQRFHVDLTMDRVQHSPPVDLADSLSRPAELEYLSYYGYSPYWKDSNRYSLGPRPRPPAARQTVLQRLDSSASSSRVRSAAEVRGYHIQGEDEPIGHVSDFIVDDATWEIRYLVIDTRNWWFGQKVLVAPHWASVISRKEKKVFVAMSRQAIKSSPRWNATATINREYEGRLYEYYGRQVYWDNPEPSEGTATSKPSRDSVGY
ncbi:MAG: PRC-barrel domain-containing protein [Pseudomonadota bacterium]